MKLKQATVFRIKIPLRQKFKHANAERAVAENILVRFETENNCTGWGETIARKYVTGETTEETFEFYKKFIPRLIGLDFKSPENIRSALSVAELEGKNCARCAIETALFDILAKQSGLPLFKYLADNLDSVRIVSRGPFYYGGAIGLANGLQTALSALKMRLFGFSKVKLKLEKNLAGDIMRLRVSRLILSKKTDLRIDANEAWDIQYAKLISPYLSKYNVSAVEQPFLKDRPELNKTFKDISPVKIILDESLCTVKDALNFAGNKYCDIFCVKIPKFGGILNVLEIFNICAAKGIPVQLSCQVGETAVLSAVGRHMAPLCPTLMYLEGSFDRFLLEQNVCSEDITFGFAGKAGLIEKPGIGIEVDERKVENLAVETIRI